MTVKLNAATGGGSVSLSAPNSTTSNADVTLTLPQNDGDANQFLQTNGSGTLTWAAPTDTGTGWTRNTTGTSLSSQSSVSFTGIPSTATKIIVAFEDLKVGSNHNWRIRLGHDSTFGGFSYHVTSWYVGASNANNGSQMTGSFQTFGLASSSYTVHGLIELDNISGNYWFGRAAMTTETSNGHVFSMWGYGDGGSNVLDRVAIATTSSTFSSGTAYCHYLEA